MLERVTALPSDRNFVYKANAIESLGRRQVFRLSFIFLSLILVDRNGGDDAIEIKGLALSAYCAKKKKLRDVGKEEDD